MSLAKYLREYRAQLAMLAETGTRRDQKVISPLFEIARVLVRFNHVVNFIDNPDDGIM
jgi:hypothetical protein